MGDLEGNRPLLAGDCKLRMWDGQATVNELVFTDDSIIRGCMFRIGVHVVSCSYCGPRILEAMTDAFFVRVRHGDELDHNNEHIRWKLAFQCQPQLPIYAGRKITDVIGNPLEVILVDTKTGSPSATPTKLHIQLVPLSGDFPGHGFDKDITAYDGKVWTDEEFGAAIVKPRNEFVPLLKGDVSLIMRDGRVTVNELQFMDDTSWVDWNVFRIGVCLLPGIYDDGPFRILEGMTKSFPVKDSRNETNTKRFRRPCVGDEVWRLQEISWGGVFHKRLVQNNVRKVQDFLRMLAVKPEQLRTVVFLHVTVLCC